MNNIISRAKQAIAEGKMPLSHQIGMNSLICASTPFFSYCNAPFVGISSKTAIIYSLASSLITTASIKIWEAAEFQLNGTNSQYPFYTDPSLESAKYACQGIEYFRNGVLENGSYCETLKILTGIAAGIIIGKKITEKTGNPLSYKQIVHLTAILTAEWASVIEVTKK